MRDGEICLNEAKDEQGKLKSSMKEIKRIQKRQVGDKDKY